MTLPTVRRAFIDTRQGQVHVRTAGAPSAHRPSIFLLHQSPASSLTYREILPYLGRDRLAVAVDTPGFGESFRPTEAPTIADYARWIAEVPRAMGFDRIDIMGLFTGAAITSEIARAFPELIRKVVLAGPPVFTVDQQRGFVDNAWPVRPQSDGSHLIAEWNRVMTRPMTGLSFDRRCDAFNEYYRGGSNAIWGELAVAVYPLIETLPHIAAPVLVLKPDGIHGDCDTAVTLLPNARLKAIPYLGYSMLQVAPAEVAARILAFLDAPNDD